MSNRKIDLIKISEKLERQPIIAYPYCAIQFNIKLPLGKKGRKEVRAIFTVDLIKGTISRADILPETRQVMLNEGSVLPEVLMIGQVVNAAQRKAKFWAFKRYRQIMAPEVELVEHKRVYHPFLVRKKGDRICLLNVVDWAVDEYALAQGSREDVRLS